MYQLSERSRKMEYWFYADASSFCVGVFVRVCACLRVCMRVGLQLQPAKRIHYPLGPVNPGCAVGF